MSKYIELEARIQGDEAIKAWTNRLDANGVKAGN